MTGLPHLFAPQWRPISQAAPEPRETVFLGSVPQGLAAISVPAESMAILSWVQNRLHGLNAPCFVQIVTFDRELAHGVAGLIASVAMEDPRFAGQVVWLSEGMVADVGQRLAHCGSALFVELRSATSLARGFIPAAPTKPAPPPWREGACYLISGGTGGVARRFAEAIATYGRNTSVILQSRRPVAAEVMADLAQRGLKLENLVCDVADAKALSDGIAALHPRMGPIAGVIHAAGLIDDGLLYTKDLSSAESLIAVKLGGARALHEATSGDRLDFFLLCSSLAAVTGNEGQSVYAFANGMLDGFAASRARAGSLSLNWPYWRDGGMQVPLPRLQELKENQGLEPMTSDAGLAAFAAALAAGGDQMAVAAGDGVRVLSAMNHTPSVAAPLPPVGPSSQSAVIIALKALLADITKRAAAEFDSEEPFSRYGIDSLAVVEVTRRLKPLFGELPRALLFEHRTIALLARHLLAHYPQAAAHWVGAQAEAPMPQAATPVPAITAAPDSEISIIGMSARFPDAPDIETFWRNLRAARDSISEIPADRWPLDGFFEADRHKATADGLSYSKWGGFLEGFAEFDPLYFNIAPREALEMDPQERLVLQEAVRALENAGITRERMAQSHGGRVGVFIGVTKSDHGRIGQVIHADGSSSHARSSFSAMANRISYILNLNGPSVPVDSMCSSSLTALHMAAQALREGQCELAIVGGVNLYQHPSSYAELCRAQMLAEDGRCRSFGNGGTGFVPGEGVACIVLALPDTAMRENYRVDALVKATAVNHGGATNGFTVPNPAAQRELLRTVIEKAGVAARSISYVEAHGTGTQLGDPIEIEGLTGAFAATETGFCAIGSVKSNIGHLEAAAGLAGVIKTVLQMQHGEIAPSLHCDPVNPAIDFASSPFIPARQLQPWTATQRIATVSSFGAGGANAAAVLAHVPASATAHADSRQHIVPLSARSADGLRLQVSQLRDWLANGAAAPAVSTILLDAVAARLGIGVADVAVDVELAELGLTSADLQQLAHIAGPLSLRQSLSEITIPTPATRQVDMARLAFTLQTGREAFAHRCAFIAATAEELLHALNAWLAAPGEGSHVSATREELAAFSANPQMQLALDGLITARDLERISGLWLRGIHFPWRKLYAQAPQPLPLPGHVFETRRLWLGDLAKSERHITTPVLAEVLPEMVETIEVADEIDTLRGIFATALDLAPDEIDDTRPFAEYGLDSILAVRFIEAVNARFATTLRTTAVFEHSSIERLAARIVLDMPKKPAAIAKARVPVVAQAAAKADERIAIIGMSGRYSGSNDLENLWQHLIAGDELVGPVQRWALPDSISCRRGGFVGGIDEFDALFFNISGAEATYMDPQQRVFLEESWLALENAGHAGEASAASACGVFVGCCGGDYQDLFLNAPSTQSLWGNMASVIPARIAYYLDLKGPVMAIDTACSSSLVAIHSACMALRQGEADMMLAGGVFLQATPKLYQSASRAGMLSPSGRCQAFDSRADGFVPGEGAGVVVLKRLSDALRDGDVIHGVIEGSGTNQNGTTNGITAPSATSQAALLSGLYARSAIAPRDIGLFESHGTGTALGDPIEFDALREVFGNKGNGTCALSSIKTQIGHAQFAAGVAGVHKILLSFRHESIAPNLHFGTANPAVELVGSPFHVPVKVEAWPRSKKRRLGAVSSFGASGANAHVIIGEGPEPRRGRHAAKAHLIVLSARSETALRVLADGLREICNQGELELGDIAFTLLAGRKHFEHRLAFVAQSLADAAQNLGAWLADSTTNLVHVGVCHRKRPGLEKTADLTQLALAFVAGATPDVRALYANSEPCRQVLPGYPFERKSYWVNAAPLEVAAPPSPAPFNLHREATGQFAIHVPAESPLLTDHHVAGAPVLPGFALAEMLRQAFVLESGQVGPVEIRDLTWLRPVRGEDAARLTLRLSTQAHGFAATVHCDAVLHAQAVVAAAPIEAFPQPAALGITQDIPPAQCRQTLNAQGIQHGPWLQALSALRLGTDALEAKLVRPQGEAMPLDPVMLDAAVQASVAFARGTGPTTVPYTVGRIVMQAPCASRMTARLCAPTPHADGSLTGLDVSLIGPDGLVAVRMQGIASRRIGKAEQKITCLIPAWSPVQLADAGTLPRNILDLRNVASGGLMPLADGDDILFIPANDRSGNSVQDARAPVLEALHLLRAVLAAKGEARRLRWTVVTTASASAGEPAGNEGTAAGLHGFAGSLAKEYPHWNVRIADIEAETGISPADIAALHAYKPSEAGILLARRAGHWLEMSLSRLENAPVDAGRAYRRGGVYVVIGGAGGVGRLWSEDVIRRCGAQVIWLGRRASDATIAAHQDALGEHGPRPEYIRADARDPAALAAARAEIIARHGRIDGMVHSAISLADVTLARMGEAELDAVLGAKMDSSVALFDVFGADVRDFFLFFSSLQSFSRMPGQGNYAAGCTFADAHALKQGDHLGKPVHVVNWGYWAQAGIVADETYRLRMARAGLVGLEPGPAMQALASMIETGTRQMAITALTPEGSVALEDRSKIYTEVKEQAPSMKTAAHLASQKTAVDAILASVGRQMSRFDAEMAEIVAASLVEAGILGSSRQPNAAPAIYGRWMAETLRALQRSGHLDAAGRLLRQPVSVAQGWQRWNEAVAQVRETADLGDHVRLAEAMMRGLGDILTSRIAATDIMFPGGSLELVSGVYNGNRVADYFNTVLCDTLERAVAQRIAQDPNVRLRMVEIGAGTGGTANRVFDRLWAYRENIGEYLYTDLSRAFLIHARHNFSSRAPYLKTAILDVGKPVDAQGVDIGGYDFAIATNVLHATRDIRQSLHSVKSCLKRNGMVLINELTENVLFSHLTFGLLDGWWAYDDADLRMEGTPALSPESWAVVLQAEGFRDVAYPAAQGRILGQQVIVAESDGMIGSQSAALPQAVEKPVEMATAPAAQPQSRRADARNLLRTLIASAIDVDAAQIADEVPLARFGVDSILVLQIVAKMRDRFPQVTSSLLFDFDTVAALADHLLAEAPAAFDNAPQPAVAAIVRPLEIVPTPMVQRAEPVASGARDIAIIGMSGRYPLAANLGEYWQNLLQGRDCVRDLPVDGRGWVRPGMEAMPAGYLDGIDRFDPLFFRLSPAEAERMDPQERLFLEESWRAMEDAGYVPQALSAQGRVGVFAGLMNAHYATRAAFWSAPNRVSFLFDFTGPSLAVDTACSSSLTALHLAAEALRAGRCEVALAGGVNVISHPRHLGNLAAFGMLSKTGRARAFGAGGDGMVSGEGVGVLVLKPLDRALADGDHVHGIIAGTAINSSGRTRSYTAPSPRAHAAVILEALADAKVSGADISAIEAHGTGTPLGDPIEIAGLEKALSGAKACALSSVKSNIGHLESAAGVAGVTKMLLQMRHRQLVPTLHASELNPEINLSSGTLRLQQAAAPWETASNGARLGGVSSFGAGGANAHVVLREAPVMPARALPPMARHIVPLSARDAAGLATRAQSLLQYLLARPGLDAAALADLAFTLQTGRAALRERVVFIVADAFELTAALREFLAGRILAVSVSEDGEGGDDSLIPVIENWIAKGEHQRIGDLWRKGIDIPWRGMWQNWQPRRLSLPVMEFAGESYWIHDREEATQSSAAAPALHAPAPTDAMAILSGVISEVLKLSVERIDTQAPLEDYGLDSVAVLQATEMLERHFGELPKTLFYEYRNLAGIAAWLDGRERLAIPAAPVVLPVRPAQIADGDIAIIGLAGRYPMAPDLNSFWNNLVSGRDCIQEIPVDRWDHAPYYSPTRARGKTRSRWGGFLENVDAFDAPFFGILPQDAELADPQERLFVETVYHAMQDAGHTRKSLAARGAVGVFAGVMYEEYQLYGAEETLRGRPTALSGSPASIANRVSWLFDFRGPSLAVDSMCSASLSAIHLALRSLRAGECSVAVAGGVNLTLHPNKYLMLGRGGFESTSGRCTSFAADGDGYVPSEGVGAVILKPLAAALADGDVIWGIVKGSAINHAGRSNGYTVPDPSSQAEVIRSALNDAGVEARSVSYVEAHGTGTSLGDPIEISGLARAYQGVTDCALGSVKSNIGHCESAAGVAGLTKVLLQMQHRKLVPSLHAARINPHLQIESSGFVLQRDLQPWKSEGRLRAGLSSFGAGGANAHVILEEAPTRMRQSAPVSGPQAILLSARNATLLPGMAIALADAIAATDEPLADIAFTLQCGREALSQRMGFVAPDRSAAIGMLRSFAANGHVPQAGHDSLSDTVRRWCAGEAIDWAALAAPGLRRVRLPLYPFERHVYWGVPRAATAELPKGEVLQFEPVFQPKALAQSVPSASPSTLLIGIGVKDLPPHAVILQHGTEDRLIGELVRLLQPQLFGGQSPACVQFVLAASAPASLFAALAGFAGSLAQEVPHLAAQVLRLGGPADAAWLAREAASGDAVVCHAAGTRRVRRMAGPVPVADAAPVSWRGNAAYVISGGAGGLGRLVAENILRESSGSQVHLLGRSAAGEALSIWLSGLGDLARRVNYHAIDIADEAALNILLAKIRSQGLPVRGILHSAGVLRDGYLMRKSPADAQAVVRAKVLGALALDRASAADDLDFFVCFSSLAGFTGNAGQADYAFANGWLDGFARDRAKAVAAGTRRGHSLSLNWPLWEEGGMQLSEAARQAVAENYGLTAMPTKAGLAALHAALAGGACQRIIAHGDASIISRRLAGGAIGMSAMIEAEVPVEPVMPVAAKVASTAELQGEILAQLLAVVAQVLRVDADSVSAEQPLADYGFDSISLADLAERCSAVMPIAVSPNIFYSGGTLEQVAQLLLQDWPKPESVSPKPVAADPEVALFAQPATEVKRQALPQADEPIAIVGMSGRFPGAADADQFWQNLVAARDVITEIPADRWDWRAIFGDPKTSPDRTDIKWGGFIDGVAEFDPAFFGITPRDAELMDPHQRLLLMHAWKAIENAGVNPEALGGHDVAVFMALGCSDYATMAATHGIIIQQSSPSGMVPSIAANRISSMLNLRGPSEPVETACSSALVALHRGIDSIRNGSQAAIIGAVNTMLTPYAHVSFARSGMLSPDGQCRAFAANANGYVRSEGVAAVMLKPLSLAQRDGNPILGLIRASGVGHGGRGVSLFAPDAAAQGELIADVLSKSGVDVSTVGVIEAHGTGTSVGDPVEFDGLCRGLGEVARRSGTSLAEGMIGVASVKSHIGHLEVCAGLASLMKVILQLRHGMLIGNRHGDSVNPAVQLSGSPFRLITRNEAWKRLSDPNGMPLPRRAAISSFGFGGVNAHMLVEEAAQPVVEAVPEGPHLLVLSAYSAKALAQTARDLHAWMQLGGNPDLRLADVAFTLREGRAPRRHRLAFVAADLAQVMAKLSGWLAGEQVPNLVSGLASRVPLERDLRQADLINLASAFVEGVACDWPRLLPQNGARRIAMPGSAMLTARHWITDGVAIAGKSEAVPASRIVHPGREMADGEWSHAAAFDSDALFLKDHVVNAKPVLPGAAHLEMVFAAVAWHGMDDASLADVGFERMVTLESLANDLRVELKRDGTGWKFTVVSGQGKALVVHSRGRAMPQPTGAPEVLPLAELRATSGLAAVEGAEFYRIFSSIGMEYGPSHRVIRDARVSAEMAIGHISQPIADVEALSAFRLPPNIADGALQVTLGLSMNRAGTQETAVPVKLEAVIVHSPMPVEAWVVATMREQGERKICDIRICDENGRVIVQMLGFMVAPLRQKPRDTRLFAPLWQTPKASGDTAPVATRLVEKVLATGLSGNVRMLSGNDAADILRHGLEQASEYLRGLPRKGGGAGELLQIVVRDRELAAFSGMVRTLGAEWPRLKAQIILCANDMAPAALEQALQQAARLADPVLRLVDGQFEARALTALPNVAGSHPWRDGGVYLITGGTGSLGGIFAAEIARQVKAPHLILTGRTQPGSRQQAQMDSLQALGARVEYHVLDVADAAGVGQLCRDIAARFGGLHGILHAAGVNEDGWLVEKSPASIARVLAPKVSGLLALDEATRGMPLDCFVLFSSITGELGNEGQADYAVANAFMDSFAAQRNLRVAAGLAQGRTLSINWPLWAGAGMGVDASTLRLLQQRFGIEPLPRHVGLEAFERAWASAQDQVLLLHGDGNRMLEWLPLAAPASGLAARVPLQPVLPPPAVAAVAQEVAKMIADLAKTLPEDMTPDLDLSDIGLDSLNFTQLAALLQARFDLEMSPASLYGMITIGDIAEHICGQAIAVPAPVVPATMVAESPKGVNAAPIAAEIAAIVAKLAKLDPDDLDADLELSDIGLDSLGFTELAGLLQMRFGVELSPATFYELPSITDIAAHIAGCQTASPVELPPSPAIAPVPVAVHPAGLERSEKTRDPGEAFAIIGMTAQLPGAADADAFWNNLINGHDAISRPPVERWDWQASDGDPRLQAGRNNVHWGGFITGLDQFDPGFFGISAAEAELMDPQHRLMMMHVWSVLESSGYAPRKLAGSNTGIIVGICSNSYVSLISAAGRENDPRWLTGNVSSLGPNRMSNMLDLRGPSEPVETACSSSLVAVHRALEALRAGDSDMVVVGGTNAMVSSELHSAFSAAGMLSPQGRCRSFAKDANGYARSEGAGFVVVKRLADAERDGDNILAVLRGSAVRHAGRSASITAPNPQSQADVVAQAWRKSGLDPASATYIEAHGTGTALGDPIEINGLKLAFEQLRVDGGHPDLPEGGCAIGAVKSHIGHLEAAAGMAGLIKVILQMRHGILAGNLHCAQVNPLIHLEASPFRLVTHNQPWVRLKDGNGVELPRRAGISSFGFGGVNAHLVLEEYLPDDEGQQRQPPNAAALIVLSAPNEDRLVAMARQLLDWARGQQPSAWLLHDTAFNLQQGRDAMKTRLGFTANDWRQFITRLEAVVDGERQASWLAHGVAGSKSLDKMIGEEEARALLAGWALRGEHDKALQAWASGLTVDFAPYRAGWQGRRMALPTYPFKLERYWVKPEAGAPPVKVAAEVPVAPQRVAPIGIQATVTSIIARFIGMAEGEIEPAMRFADMGVDSIGLLNIASRLCAAIPNLDQSSLAGRMVTAETVEALCRVVDGSMAMESQPPVQAIAAAAKPLPVHAGETVRLDMYGKLLKQDMANLLINRMRLISKEPPSAQASLIVDESHPFFFDHPLDHVSGMHLAEAMVQLARTLHLHQSHHAAKHPLFLKQLRFNFREMCLKEPPAEIISNLLAASSQTSEYEAQARQSGVLLADARLVLGELGDLAPCKPAAAGRRVDRRWVNKQDVRNVLLGGLRREGDELAARLNVDPRASYFQDFPGGMVDAMVLAEAVRQLMRVRLRMDAAAMALPKTNVGLLKHIELTLTRPVVRGEQIELQTAPMEPVALAGALLFNVTGSIVSLPRHEVVGGYSVSALSLSRDMQEAWGKLKNK